VSDFGNTLAPVKLFDSTPNPGIDGAFVFQQPAILFFLSFEKVEQSFVRARGAGVFARHWNIRRAKIFG
jgi:hypothetical protein